MTADLTTLQTWITEAQEAMHKLATGAAVVDISRDGRRIKYNASNKGDLAKYIADLKLQIAALEAEAAGKLAPRRRSFGVVWGG